MHSCLFPLHRKWTKLDTTKTLVPNSSHKLQAKRQPVRNSSKQHLIHAAHQIPTVPVPVQTSSNNHFCTALHVGCINYVTCNATGAPQNLEQATSCSLPFAIPGCLSPLLYFFLFGPSLYSKSQLSDKGVCVPRL